METKIDMAMDEDFGSKERAEAEAMRYVSRLGKLPTSLRKGLHRMVVHQGDATAFGGDGCIILYSENASKRISTRDLEETIFHESIHASWDNDHADSKGWRAAQESDGQFVTDYARKRPDREDLAESALFAYTLVHHPERIPKEESERIRAAIPARIAYVKKLLPPDKPIHYQVAPKYACDGSDKTFVLSDDRFDHSLAEHERKVEGSPKTTHCRVDLRLPGQMSDIISNALMHGFNKQEGKVRKYLDGCMGQFTDSELLLKAAAKEFGLEVEKLRAMVDEYHHVNCNHGPLGKTPPDSK